MNAEKLISTVLHDMDLTDRLYLQSGK